MGFHGVELELCNAFSKEGDARTEGNWTNLGDASTGSATKIHEWFILRIAE